jgi:uncharacterized Zn-finger protein
MAFFRLFTAAEVECPFCRIHYIIDTHYRIHRCPFCKEQIVLNTGSIDWKCNHKKEARDA